MKPTILIADDDVLHRKLLTDVLQAEGYGVVTAENGELALELARSARPGLVIMDVQMPVLDGIETVKALKKDPDMRSIPVVAVSARAMNGDRDRILGAGFDGYLSKPLSLKELRAEVQRHLGVRRESAELPTEGAACHD